MTAKKHREHLLIALLGALGLPLTGCGDKYSHELCRALPADGQCMSKRDLWRELRGDRRGCESTLVSLDSEAMIKYPEFSPGLFHPPQLPPTQSTGNFTSATGPQTGATTSQTSGTDNNSSSVITSTETGTTTSTGASTTSATSTASSTSSSTWTGGFYPPPKLACCYRATSREHKIVTCVEGRPLLQGEGGAPVLASIEPGTGWASDDLQEALPDLASLDPDARAAMAKEWRTIAAQEHASIAAFAQLSLELMRYGAPAKLIEACQSCMQDEIRHAKLAFRWAGHLTGHELSPGPMPDLAARPPSPNLRALALANLEEGCCNETLASLMMLDRAQRCAHEGMRNAILQIAQDEQRHAQFAWQLTQWFLEQEPSLWRVLDARMDEFLAQGVAPALSQRDETLCQGRSEVLLPLWQQMKRQSPQFA